MIVLLTMPLSTPLLKEKSRSSSVSSSTGVPKILLRSFSFLVETTLYSLRVEPYYFLVVPPPPTGFLLTFFTSKSYDDYFIFILSTLLILFKLLDFVPSFFPEKLPVLRELLLLVCLENLRVFDFSVPNAALSSMQERVGLGSVKSICFLAVIE